MGYYSDSAVLTPKLNSSTAKSSVADFISGKASRNPSTSSQLGKYHINEKGDPGICKAKIACRFGDSQSTHFNTPTEARDAYEHQMESYIDFKESPIGKLDNIANKIVMKISKSYDKTVEWIDKNPVKTIAIAATLVIVAGAYYGSKIAQNMTTDYSGVTSKPVNGTVSSMEVDGYFGKTTRMKIGVDYPGQETVYAEQNIIKPNVNSLPAAKEYLGYDVGTEVSGEVWSNGRIETGLGSGSNGAPLTPEAVAASDQAVASTVGAWSGGTAGVAGLTLGTMLTRILPIDQTKQYLDTKWATRHGDKFSLVR